MELHNHSHLRDAHRDEDVFVILSLFLSRVSLEPPSHHVRHLYAIMLLILRNVSLTFGFVLGYRDHTFDDGWFHVTRFPIYHTSMPYWAIFLFRLRVIDLHGVARSSPPTGYTPRRGPIRYFIVILQWSLSWVIHPDPHLSALRCHHTSSFEVRLFDPWVWFSYGFGWWGSHFWG